VGIVRDPGRVPVGGIVVQLRGPAELSAITNAAGEFRFDALNPGSYEIRLAVDGFEPIAQKVRPGARVNLELRLATRMERIDVGSSSGLALDTGENGAAITVERGLLDHLPALDLDLISAMGRFLDGGAMSTGGAQLVVDGAESRNLGVTPSAIQEIKINNNPYAAEYPRWSRRRIEVITKSGADSFHGTFNFVLRDYHFNARDPFAPARPEEQRKIFEGSLLGPVGKQKRTSFLLTGMREDEQLLAIVNAVGPHGPINENVPAPQFNTYASARLSHAFSDRHAIFGQINYQDKWRNNVNVGGIVTAEAGVQTRFREDEFVFNHRGVYSPNLISQFRILLGRYYSPVVSNTEAPRLTISDAIVFGGAQSDRLTTEFHSVITGMVAYTRNRHSMKFGINVPDWSRRGMRDETFQLGSLFYGSLGDFNAQRPFAAQLQRGNPSVVFIEKNVGGFFSDEIQLRPGLSLNFGARYDWQNYFGDGNNIQPRLAVAWAPGKQRKWVMRLGSGIFYERSGPAPIFDILRFDGQRLRRYLLSAADIGRPIDEIPTAIDRLDPAVQIPGLVQYSLALERQIGKKTTVSMQYIGVRGWHYFRSRDANAPQPSTNFAFRPDPTVGQFRQIESAARWRGQSFDVTARGTLAPRVTGMLVYVWSQMNSDFLGLANFPAASYAPGGEFGRDEWDRRHRVMGMGTAALHRWVNLGFSIEASTNSPFNITTGRDENNDGLPLDRPPGVGRNTGIGPNLVQIDLRWYREFALRPSRKDRSPKLQVSVDSFNLVNRFNPKSYMGALTSPFFGQPVSALPARRIQFGLRFQF
jgi:hypothetical protein